MHGKRLQVGSVLVSGILAGLLVLVGMSRAMATENVLVMPDRDALVGAAIVVWGNTKFANDTSMFEIDFGDATAVESGMVTDRSYIATTHTYTDAGVFTVTLTVTPDGGAAESETATVEVFDPANLSGSEHRGILVNNAIQDGLRWLYVNQDSRAANFDAVTTSWAGNRGFAERNSYTSLVVLAYENHGHLVTNDPLKDIYQAVVQRGLNFLFDNLGIQELTVQTAGDPCVGVPDDADKCKGLAQNFDSPTGYSTSIAALALAGSGAPDRTVEAGLGTGASGGVGGNGGFVAGKTYGEILQRIVNTIVWAQADSGTNQGGWRYGLNDNQSDGSAIGWAVLALFDGQATGATVPAFVATELATVIGNTSCGDPPLSDGLAYTACFSGGGNLLRTGVALQALNFMGVDVSDDRVQQALTYINTAWNGPHPNGESFACSTPSDLPAALPDDYTDSDFVGGGTPSGSTNNKGCAYAMFQAFKGLQLYGIPTLANSMRADNNWKKEYEDYLVANQQDPTDPAGGSWNLPQMHWSCCDEDQRGITALAELILSPVALVRPNTLMLEPATATNAVDTEHTVTATALSAVGGPVPAATVTFTVIDGPNLGTTGDAVTDAQGQASFTYTGSGGLGTDQIRANIGTLQSNIVEKTWTSGFDPFGGLVRTPRRNILLTLTKPTPDTEAVRCVEADDPMNPDFGDTPFTEFPNGEVDIDFTLSGGEGNKTVCCEFVDMAGAVTQSSCADIELFTLLEASCGVESPSTDDVLKPALPVQDLSVLQVHLETGEEESVDIEAVDVTFDTADDLLLPSMTVKLIHDANGNGVVDASEAVLATEMISGPAQTVTLQIVPPFGMAPNSEADLLVALDIPGDTTTASLFTSPLTPGAGTWIGSLALLPVVLGLAFFPWGRRRFPWLSIGLVILALCCSIALWGCPGDNGTEFDFTVSLAADGVTARGAVSGVVTFPEAGCSAGTVWGAL